MAMTADYQAAWYQANRERLLVEAKERRQAKREEIRSYKQRYQQENGKAIAAKKREYYLANKDAISESHREHYRKNVERVRGKVSVYRSANRDRILKYLRKYWAANAESKATYRKLRRKSDYAFRERERARSAQWYRSHRDDPAFLAMQKAYEKAWRLAHPQKRCEKEARRRAQKRQSFTERVDYERIWQLSQGACAICGLSVKRSDVHFDHRIPLVKGGAHSSENIQVAHSKCNLRKGAAVLC